MAKHKKSTKHGKSHAKHEDTKKTHKEKKSVESKSDKSIMWVALLVLGVVLVAAGAKMLMGDKEPVEPITTDPVEFSGEKVKLDFYVMSQCPYGTQVEDAIAPVLEKIGSHVDFNLEFIATDNGDGTFRALHGQNEVDGNIVQLCAAKYNPNSYMKMITCQNQNAGAIPGNWEKCAGDNGLAVESIRSCYEGEEGKELLRTSLQKAQAVKATGSPTIYLAGEKYSGGRTSDDFMRALCDAMDEKPEACNDLPEPVEVNVIVLSDVRCDSCTALADKLMTQLKGLFPGIKYTTHDYADEDGREVYDAAGIKYLPAFLFDDSVKEAQNYAGVAQYLIEAGEYQSLRIGASFDPAAEICDNEIDDDADGQVDCADDQCASQLICREEIENNLQVFIMSDCPYGREAVKALKEVKDNFEGSMDFEIHYIASETAEGFSSLHGQYELDENIVQLCALEHSPDEWFDYVHCRSTNGVRGVDWKTCGEESGIDVDAVEECFLSDEGAELLREDIQIAQGLGVSASPTWLANNKYKFSGIAAEPVKQSFCQYNEDTPGCENTLTATAAAPSGACG